MGIIGVFVDVLHSCYQSLPQKFPVEIALVDVVTNYCLKTAEVYMSPDYTMFSAYHLKETKCIYF